MTHPLLNALAQARLRDAPMFVKWCELNDAVACPASPASVARFLADCSALGVGRLWSAVQDISRMHVARGLADPTLGGAAATAMSAIARVAPPRSWAASWKQRFETLPYDVQLHLASHEAQRERALRRAQNEAASARQKLTALESQMKDTTTHASQAAEQGEPSRPD